MLRIPPISTLFPYTTLFRSHLNEQVVLGIEVRRGIQEWLSFYFKSPMCAPDLNPEHDLFIQMRSEEHTTEIQSLTNLVCRIMLEKSDRVYQSITTHEAIVH